MYVCIYFSYRKKDRKKVFVKDSISKHKKM